MGFYNRKSQCYRDFGVLIEADIASIACVILAYSTTMQVPFYHFAENNK